MSFNYLAKDDDISYFSYLTDLYTDTGALYSQCQACVSALFKKRTYAGLTGDLPNGIFTVKHVYLAMIC